MKKHAPLIVLFMTFVGVLLAASFYVSTKDAALLNPAGLIARQQKNLMFTALLLMLIVVVPVYVMLMFIGIRYRAGNHSAAYKPNWDSSRIFETIWWLVPFCIILVLAIITWKSSHDLDPFKPIASDKKPLTIQVVALEWKWLFIYPEYGIATVNYIQIPEDTPVKFQITSDAPMNSLWIPKLAGQIYAMSGMSTELNIMADEPGTYDGMSGNISGEGFAGMRFKVYASTQDAFNGWVQTSRHETNRLSQDAYDALAMPSENNRQATFSPVQNNLFEGIIMKYMHSDPVNTDEDISPKMNTMKHQGAH